MGKAIIVEHVDHGSYLVDIIRFSQRVKDSITAYEKQAADLQDKSDEYYAAMQIAESEMLAAKALFEIDPSTLPDYSLKMGLYELATKHYYETVQRIMEVEDQVLILTDKISPRRAQIWCSTYTTNLTAGTEVATIEVARQGSSMPYSVIAPLGAAPDAEDGVLRDVMSMTPAQAFMNYALSTGAAKWRRRYNIGTVYAIDIENHKVQVWLDILNVAGIYIHPEEAPETWFDVSIVCPESLNHSDNFPFRIGDKVLLQYDDSLPTTVIGWAEWPRKCIGTNTLTIYLREHYIGWQEPSIYSGARIEHVTPHHAANSLQGDTLLSGSVSAVYEDGEWTYSYTNGLVSYCLTAEGGNRDVAPALFGILNGSTADGQSVSQYGFSPSWLLDDYFKMTFNKPSNDESGQGFFSTSIGPILITDPMMLYWISQSTLPTSWNGEYYLYVVSDGSNVHYYRGEDVRRCILDKTAPITMIGSSRRCYCYSSGFKKNDNSLAVYFDVVMPYYLETNQRGEYLWNPIGEG